MEQCSLASFIAVSLIFTGRSAPPIACHNAGNWFTMAQTKREVVKSVEKSPKVPTNFANRFQSGRFAKRSGLSREYTFSAYDNRLEESRHTRKGLQWDHRKVYETPSFLVRAQSVMIRNLRVDEKSSSTYPRELNFCKKLW